MYYIIRKFLLAIWKFQVGNNLALTFARCTQPCVQVVQPCMMVARLLLNGKTVCIPLVNLTLTCKITYTMIIYIIIKY